MAKRRTAEMMGRPLTDEEKLDNITWFMEHCSKCDGQIGWGTDKCPHCGYHNLALPANEGHMNNDQPVAARPREEVEREFMSRNQPHTEGHWWAISEIERLREENARLLSELGLPTLTEKEAAT